MTSSAKPVRRVAFIKGGRGEKNKLFMNNIEFLLFVLVFCDMCRDRSGLEGGLR